MWHQTQSEDHFRPRVKIHLRALETPDHCLGVANLAHLNGMFRNPHLGIKATNLSVGTLEQHKVLLDQGDAMPALEEVTQSKGIMGEEWAEAWPIMQKVRIVSLSQGTLPTSSTA